ncbi:MAG: orotidine-5'-phosphate decarboxylase [Candidatus Thermoplasmatota archaeon]|jgi:orotidine-5'-phosphate decarboxylase|nr:orotidine-5'-phosphate decarboxylase [Candidatus Thermoplasmatota archaeon]
MGFKEKLLNIVHENDSLVCVGLDIDQEKMPKFLFDTSKDPFFDFNKSIIDETKDLVCAYKLNMAFYEILGLEGFKLLEKTVKHIPRNVVVILDGKRNDIGNTAKKYAKSLFETYKADAVTVNPYLGIDGVKPFLEYKDKCSFILCRTSNPSAVDFQDLKTQGKPLYQMVAEKIKEWNKIGYCGAVVGATYQDELKIIRGILGDNIPLLIPGIGKQGGDVEKTVRYGANRDGEMAVINSSREIIFAGDKEDFAEKSRDRASSLRKEINKYR